MGSPRGWSAAPDLDSRTPLPYDTELSNASATEISSGRILNRRTFAPFEPAHLFGQKTSGRGFMWTSRKQDDEK